MTPCVTKKILLPVDFSEMSPELLETGVELGRSLAAEVTLLHVAREPGEELPAYVFGVGDRVSAARLREESRAALEGRLREMARRVAAESEVRIRLEWGEPAKTILGVARAEDFDLIVIATHGRKSLSRLFMGSVAEEVIRRAHCPVFVVRRKESAERAEKGERETAAARG